MAYTTQQLDDLEAAIAEGVLVVKYEDRTVTYRSLADMRSLRDEMRGELGLNTKRTSGTRLVPTKGLRPRVDRQDQGLW